MPTLNLHADNLVVRLNVDNYKIIVKQPQFPLQITGATFYQFVESGQTVISTQQTGNIVTVTIYTPSGTTVDWVNVLNKPNLVLESTFSGYTGTTDLRLQGIEGNIIYLSGQTDNKLDTSIYSTYTGTTVPQILLGYSLSGHTHPQYLTGVTWTMIGGKPDLWTTGETITAITNYSAPKIHYHNQYLTGVTWQQIAGNPTGNTNLMNLLSNYVDFTTYNFNNNILSQQLQTINDGLTWLSGHTGTTYTFTPSGITQIQQLGNNVVIYVPPDSITGITWSMVTGKPALWDTGQTMTAITDYSAPIVHYHNQYLTGFTVTAGMVTGITSVLYAPIIHYHPQYLTGVTAGMVTGITDTLYLHNNALQGFWNSGQTTGFTENTYAKIIHYHPQYLTGVTWIDVSGKPNLTLYSDFTGHTTDGSIHFTMSAITITENQVQNLVSDLSHKSNTGHTHSQYLTGVTWVDISGNPTGSTNLMNLFSNYVDYTTYNYNNNILSQDLQGIHNDISYLSGHTPSLAGYWNSGETIIYINGRNFLTGVTASEITGVTSGLYAPIVHYHNQYLTGVTWTDVSGKPNLVLKSDYDTYTGTTAPNEFAQKVHSHSYTGATITDKPSFQGSGATTVQLVNNVYRIYSPTVSSADWLTLTNRPSWLTGTTLLAFEAQHSHPGVYLPIANTISGGTNLGTGHVIFSGVTANKINAKSIKAGSNVTITHDVNSITIASTGGGGSGALSGCTDVNISAPSTYDVLSYTGGSTNKWIKNTPVDIFANVGDTQLLARNGSSITGVTQTNVLTNVINGETLIRSGSTVVSTPTLHLMRTTANQTINAGAATFTDVTNLTFPVVSGTSYAFFFYVTFRSAAATTGWKMSVNCPTGDLDYWAGSQTIANGAAGVATHTERHNVDRDDMTLLTSTVTANVNLANRIEGRYLCTQSGTFACRFANELSADTNIVIQKGSYGWWF